MTKKKKTVGKTDADVILIGAGIMSATLGVLLKELEPNLSIEIYERLDMRLRKVLMPGIMPAQATLHFAS